MMNHPKYRADIDGLRAIAVLAVIGYHAFPQALKGGFAGVDMFFVISGALISSIIFESVQQGQFSFFTFYGRRIRRIFPALICVLLASIILGWFVLVSDEFELLGRHVTAGAAFVSNLLLWQESGYFDSASAAKPLLHLWSLGIEEQFYIFWPLLVYGAARKKISLPGLMLFVFCGSLLIAITRFHHTQTSAFYSPLTRFWELMIGCLLAYKTSNSLTVEEVPLFWVNSHPSRISFFWKQKITHQAFSIVGTGMIGLGLYAVTEHALYPGWLTLLPTVGTSLVIAAGSQPWINRRLLSSHLMTSIGKISYPLYLWHWPLLAYAHILGNNTLWMRLILIAVCFVLSWATYRYVERPLRFSTAHARQKTWGLIAAMTLVGFIGYGGLSFDLIEPRLAAEDIKGLNAPKTFMHDLVTFNAGSRMYYFLPGSQSQKTVFWGDSNAAQYVPRIRKLLVDKKNRTNSTIFMIEWGCPPIPNVLDDVIHPQCRGSAENALEAIRSDKDIETVVVAAEWVSYFWAPQHTEFYYVSKEHPNDSSDYLGPGMPGSLRAFESLKNMLLDLRAAGKKTILILNIPVGGDYNPRSLIESRIHGSHIVFKEKPDTRTAFMQRYGVIRAGLVDAAEASGTKIIDPMSTLCDETSCKAFENGKPIYFDDEHLRPFFVSEKAAYIDETVLR